MAQRRRHSTGTSLIPSSSKIGRFVLSTALIVGGLVLIFIKDLGGGASVAQNLVTQEGTLSNYSFKKNEAGEKTYGIWLREISELLVLPEHQTASFDTTAFKNLVKPGDRLQVEYNKRENVMASNGNRKLYGLAVPAKNITFFTGEDSLKSEQNDWLSWLAYLLIGGGVILFIFQMVRLQKEDREGSENS